jgi:hypothetical protein
MGGEDIISYPGRSLICHPVEGRGSVARHGDSRQYPVLRRGDKKNRAGYSTLFPLSLTPSS